MFNYRAGRPWSASVVHLANQRRWKPEEIMVIRHISRCKVNWGSLEGKVECNNIKERKHSYLKKQLSVRESVCPSLFVHVHWSLCHVFDPTAYVRRLPQNIFCLRAKIFKRKLSMKMHIFSPTKCLELGVSVSVTDILCLSQFSPSYN